jgi:hypothetical protein
MPTYTLYVVDLVAICVLVFGLFLPRHQRPELIIAFLTVNIGVLAVTWALSNSTVGAGLGLGLFGILSIIRLRSEELTQVRSPTTSRRSPWDSSAGWGAPVRGSR